MRQVASLALHFNGCGVVKRVRKTDYGRGVGFTFRTVLQIYSAFVLVDCTKGNGLSAISISRYQVGKGSTGVTISPLVASAVLTAIKIFVRCERAIKGGANSMPISEQLANSSSMFGSVSDEHFFVCPNVPVEVLIYGRAKRLAGERNG